MIIQFLLFLITAVLIRYIYRAIWIPFRVQKMMHSQGIKGPSYRIVYGTTKESMILKQEAFKGPMELSHDIFPKIQPQFFQWMKLYGKNFITWTGPQPHVVITEPEIGKTASMIINETLRLYSPATSLVRRGTRRVNLGKYEFPARMEYHIPTLALHRDKEIWGEEAHLFKPERFAQGIAAATKNNPMAFLPFEYGPRTCVGLNFASTEAKIALSMILQRYEFTLSPNYAHFPVKTTMWCADLAPTIEVIMLF